MMVHCRTALLGIALVVGLASLVSAKNGDEPTWSVESVEITGNEAFEDDMLRSLMVTRPLGWFRSSEFRPQVFRNDLANLLEFYRQEGYLSAQIVDTQVVRDSAEHDVHISLTVQEGPVTTVEGVGLFGNQAFADSTLRGLIELEPGDPFRRLVLQQGMLNIAAFYADSGYLEAAVTPETKVNEQANRVVVDLNVREGRQVRISGIAIQGLMKTDASVVRRDLQFEEGEIISYSALLKSQRKLYRTGLFKSVYIEPVNQPEDSVGERTVVVRLDEKLNSLFTVSVGYGSIEKAIGEIELSTNNLAGTGRQVGGRLEANFIERRLEGSFTEPRTFDTQFKTDLNLFFAVEDQPSYDVRRYGGLATIGREIGEDGHLMLRYRHENQQLRHIEIDELPEDLDPRIRSVTIAFTRDTRDNLFNPVRGLYTDLRYELAGAFLQGSNTFNRVTAGARWFQPLRRNTVLGLNLEAGWMDVFGEERGIPLSERFFTGGPNSIRGFAYQEVGPRDELRQFIGGQIMVVANAEIRQAVWRWVGIVAFIDAGNVWEKPPQFRFNEIRSAAGGGIRVNTPLGIVRLDYGWALDPEADEDGSQLFFSMGHAF